MRRPTALTLACLAAGLVLAAQPAAALAAPAAPAALAGTPAADSPAANLVANGDFEARDPFASWTCDDGVSKYRRWGGSEFIQFGPRGDEPRSTASPAAAAAFAARAVAAQPTEDDGLPGMRQGLQSTNLIGDPDNQQRAECGQTVPVRPWSTYTLSAEVSGGMVFLGSDYGVTWTPDATSSKTLTTTFTTAAAVDSVRIYMHGWYGGKEFNVDNVVLTGPDSETRVPVAPSGLHADLYTSRALALSWAGSPGATSYRVYRDGALVDTLAGTWTRIFGLTAGHPYEFTVKAVNAAGESAPSTALVTESAPAYASPPEALDEVTGEQWGPGEIKLRWSPPESATDGHYVYVDGVRAGWITGPRGLLVDLTPGEYTIEVTSLNSAGESPKSPPVTVTVEESAG